MFRIVAKIMSAVSWLVFVASGPTQAGTPDQARALAERAAVLVASEGENAFARISDPDGEYSRGELFVVVLDRDVVVRAIRNPNLIGVSMKEAADPDGIRFADELLLIAQSRVSGWLTYKYANPVSKRIEPKKTWVVKAGDFAVFCGAYVNP